MKRCSISSVIREMQIQTTIRYHCIRMAKNQTKTELTLSEYTEQMEFSHCWCKMAQLLTVSCKIKHTLPIQPRNPTLTSTSKRNENLYPHKNLYMIVYLCSAKSLQSFPTLCDPIDGSPPGSPVPGFSRQEHWSGLPFPSPVHESEK